MKNRKHFGVMIDCSRNAVMSVEALKRYIDLLQKMGYNTLMLYTEETYEVENEPYFGYLRGRYTADELKEINGYCEEKGIELIPCIQTLAHLNGLTKWDEYANIIDTKDILLIDDKRTYELIENMFRTLSNCFTSRLVHIGMDEAEMVGLGKYLKNHGYDDRFKLLDKHLHRVVEIAKKYGFEPMMWSDMFFKLAAGTYYIDDEKLITDEIVNKVTTEVDFVYWDYYSTDKKSYDVMIKAHKKFKKPLWFAGGFWTWTGLVPHNGYTINATREAVEACIENNVDNMFFTMWGDNGGECSVFSVIPSMFYTSEICKGITDEKIIKADFKKMFGIDFDEFMLLDLPGISSGDKVTNSEKYMLYSDYFLGFLDPLESEEKVTVYKCLSEKLANIPESNPFSYIFECEKCLCDVLELKSNIGIKTRRAYQSNDREALKKLSPVYDEIALRLKAFLISFRKMWFKDKKPYGFEVQEARLGGLIERTNSCKNRLEMYLDGETERIDELEETLLDPLCRKENAMGKKDITFNSWQESFMNL